MLKIKYENINPMKVYKYLDSIFTLDKYLLKNQQIMINSLICTIVTKNLFDELVIQSLLVLTLINNFNIERLKIIETEIIIETKENISTITINKNSIVQVYTLEYTKEKYLKNALKLFNKA